MSNPLKNYEEKLKQFYSDLNKMLRDERTRGNPLEVNPDWEPERENLEVLQEMVSRGYKISWNFHSMDAVQGEVIVEIDDKWFQIGWCRQKPLTEEEKAHEPEHMWRIGKYQKIGVGEILPRARVREFVELGYCGPISYSTSSL